MSLLMDALNKVDKMVETKQPYCNQTVDSSSSTNEYDEELFLAEITDNEIPKKTLPHLEDSSLKEPNDESLIDFKEIESQQQTTLPDSDQSSDFSLIDWQPPLENNETNTDSTSHNWDDELLPQFQDKIQENSDKVDSTTTEPLHQEWSDFQKEIQDDSDKVNSTTAEQLRQEWSDLSDFHNEQQLVDFKNEDIDIESTLPDNLNQSATVKPDSPQLKTVMPETVTQTQPEFELKLEAKNTEATQTDQTLFLDEIFSSTAQANIPQLQTATRAAQKEETQPHFEFKLEDNKREETQTEQGFFLDDTQNVPHPEAARRVLAASAAPQTASKRTVLLTGVLTVLLAGTAYYYYSQSSLAEPFSFKTQRPLLTSTSISPPVQKPLETEQPSSAQNPQLPNSSPPAPFKATHKPVDEPNQAAVTTETTAKQSAIQATVTHPIKIGQSENTATESLTQSQSKVTQPKASNQPTTAQKQITAPTNQSLKQPITQAKHQQTLAQSPQQSTITDLKAKKQLQPQHQESKLKTPGIHTLRKNKVIQSINKALSTGYNAFQQGDDSTALRSYLNALRQDQNNRDALFGLAALALRSGNLPQAQQYYRRVLQLYPQDRYAQVGLINSLDNQASSSESQLKILLEQAPQSAYIHFSLGHFYAAQGRWAQAQSAYFNAYRYDKEQADYAYNLAVSLDQLNQPSAALTYYQRALQQIQNQAIHFNPETVRQRMQTIKQHTQPSALFNDLM